MSVSRRLFVLVGSAVLWTACASIKPPTVRVAGIHLDGVSLTGARVDVGLQIRNVNPEDLQIERFDYEVRLNGKVLGRGYQAEPLMLRGFAEERVVSRLDVSFLKIPGVVKNALDRDRVEAEVKGTFYLREGSGLRKMKFGSRGEVDLNRGPSRDSRD
ncbi:MAG: LEA type 2 family protein [Vicinamibacteria bacterium]|nr:LEA type 2 family protein [Vicinamibacteria bacterium]